MNTVPIARCGDAVCPWTGVSIPFIGCHLVTDELASAQQVREHCDTVGLFTGQIDEERQLIIVACFTNRPVVRVTETELGYELFHLEGHVSRGQWEAFACVFRERGYWWFVVKMNDEVHALYLTVNKNFEIIESDIVPLSQVAFAFEERHTH